MKVIVRLKEKDSNKSKRERILTVARISEIIDGFMLESDDGENVVFVGEENAYISREESQRLKRFIALQGYEDAEITYIKSEKELALDELEKSIGEFNPSDDEVSSDRTDEGESSSEDDDAEKTRTQSASMPDIDAMVEAFKKRNKTAEEKSEKQCDEAESAQTFGEKQKNIAALKTALLKEVKGQQHAVDAFVRAYFGAEVIVEKEHKGPLATFLFAGPPGCGKTYLSECASKVLKGRKFVRFDMSEYGEMGAIVNGVDAINQSGMITEYVSKNPKSIILFDEIEKASEKNLKLFLQILDSGSIRDGGTKKEVSFRDTILIFTTNVAKNLYDEAEETNLSGISKSTIVSALERDENPTTGKPYFPKELVSRWAKGTVVLFNRLEPYALKEIVFKELKHRIAVAEENTGIKIECDFDKIASLIMYSVGGSGDARSMLGAVMRFVESELFDALSQLTRRNMDVDKLKKIYIDVDCKKSAVGGLFDENAKVPVLFAVGAKCGKDIKNACTLEKGITPIVRSDIATIKSACNGMADAVVLDVFLKEKKTGDSPSDFEDINSVGVEIFEYLIANHPEIPVYILNDEDAGFDDVAYDTFLSRGAKGIIRYRKGNAIYNSENLAFVRLSALTGNNFYKLAKGSNVVSYNCSQVIEDEGETLRITVKKLGIKRAVRADDVNSIVGDLSRPKIKFSDVVGANEVKEALRDCVSYLQNPKKYTSNGRKAPKGIILYGPPGTGKTMLAKALAGETDVAFIEKNGTEFFKMYVGQGPQSMRDMFRTARRYAPSIIFIDEVNAFARKRSGSDVVASTEQLLNTFLSEMDGFKNNDAKPVIVLCATNYAVSAENSESDTVLDQAFVRRFDKKILVDLPELDDRRALLNHFFKLNGVSPDRLKRGLELLAKKTAGYCNDALKKLVEDIIKRAEGDEITDKMLEEAYDRAEHGAAKTYSEGSVLRTARHEAGHAIVSWANGNVPSYITVISRGNYGGYMMSDRDEKESVLSKSDVLDEICCALGGRAAELVYYGEEGGKTTGPSSDLVKATRLAYRLVNDWGMQDGRLAVASLFGDAMMKDVYAEVNTVLQAQLERAVKVISAYRDETEKLVDALIRFNSLDADGVKEIIGETPAKTEK